jgi:hypothetical protein
MSIVEKRSAAHGVDYVVEDRHMCATTRIYIGLVVALAIYILGIVVLLQDVGGGAPQNTAEMSFLGR